MVLRTIPLARLGHRYKILIYCHKVLIFAVYYIMTISTNNFAFIKFGFNLFPIVFTLAAYCEFFIRRIMMKMKSSILRNISCSPAAFFALASLIFYTSLFPLNLLILEIQVLQYLIFPVAFVLHIKQIPLVFPYLTAPS